MRSVHISRYSHFKIRYLKNVGQDHKCITFAVAPLPLQIPDFQTLMEIVMFALSLTVYTILTNYEQLQNFDLENEGQDQGVEEQDFQLEMFESI